MPIKSPVIAKILRITFIIGIVLLPGLFVSAQVKFTTVIPSQEMGKSDYLQIEFVVENAKQQIDDLTPPDFAGFRVVQGPIQSNGMSIVNGNMSQYRAVSFVLEPTKTGKFTIPGATATVDGKHMQSNTVTITVHAGGSGNANQNSQQRQQSPFGGNPFNSPFFQPNMPDPFGNGSQPDQVDRDFVLKPGENPKEKIKKGLFVKVQVDKNTCYVGEPIVATYKLYTRVGSESRITKRPSLNGFSVYDMIDPNQDAISVEKLNGKNYTVHTIRKTQLIPLQAGTIDLDPMEIENTVHFVRAASRNNERSGNSMRDLLDAMTDDGYGEEVDENVTLDTKPLPITVKPLPDASKPAGFNGAVGNFSVEASVDHKSLSADDEATLHVVVKGKGNLPVIAAPVVNWPTGFQAFDPTTKEDINKAVAPMAGSKSFDYVFTPGAAGHFTIPEINFPYFDPASQTYKTAETQPMDIQVTPAAGSHAKPGDKKTAQQQPQTRTIVDYARDYGIWIAAFLVLGGVATYFWRQNRKLRKASKEEKIDSTVKEQNRSAVEKAAIMEKIAAAAAASAATDKSNSPVRENPAPKNNPALKNPASKEERAVKEPVIQPTTYVSAAPPVDPLQEARSFLEREDPKGFYREVNRAIWKAMSKKLDLPASELNKANSIRQLQLRGWDNTTLMSLENLLNECEMNLYTPAYDRWNMQQLLSQAERLVDRLA